MSHHIVFTVSGTGTNMWDTTSPQPAGIAATLVANHPETFFWQPVGDYPAATFPMGASAQDGINSLIYMLTGEPVEGSNTTVPGPTYTENSFILIGYSQGAIVVCGFIQWCFANGRTDILERLVAVVTLGNPCRLPGFASGNDFAGWPAPGLVDGYVTGGIAGPGTVGPGCMVPAQIQPQLKTPVTHYWGEFVNTIGQGNDLYADCPTGPSPVTLDGEALPGSLETLVYDLVQQIGSADLPALTLAIGRILGTEQIPEAIALGQAILNGGMFFLAGPTAAHYTYDTAPMVTFLTLAGTATAPWGPA